MLLTSGLINVINIPTRMGAHLDPILVSNLDIVIDSEVIDIDRALIDHNATLVNIKVQNTKKNSLIRKIWLYKYADYSKLNEEISQFQWETFLMECESVDLMAKRFTNKYLEMIERHIPSKTVRIRPNDKPWFNSKSKEKLELGIGCTNHFVKNILLFRYSDSRHKEIKLII